MKIAGTCLLLFAFFCLAGAQDRIDTLKIFDRADNLLYFIRYDYGTDSILTGQSLYDRTGYFLKTITVDNSGKRSYRDNNGDLYHYSISRTDGARNYFDLYDRFNKAAEQRVSQGYYSQGATAGLVEFFNLSGGLTHRMQYEYNGSQIQRINVLDNAGVISHHVDVHYVNWPITVEGALAAGGKDFLDLRAGLQGLSVYFVLQSAGRARIEVFDVRGRRAGGLLDRVLPAGPTRLFCGIREFAFARTAGVYLVRISLNDRLYFRKMVVLN